MARREVGVLAEGLPQELREDLQLLVSELVANSLRHAELSDADWIGLRASVGTDTVRVEVSDPGHFQPPKGKDPGAPPSRTGLWMLNQIANRWGLVRDGDTLVWFEADLPHCDAVAPWAEATRAWPEAALDKACDLVRMFGPPDASDATSLTWTRNGVLRLTLAPDLV